MLSKINHVKRFLQSIHQQVVNPHHPRALTELPSSLAKGYMIVDIGYGYQLAEHKKTTIVDACTYVTENNIMQRLVDDCEVDYTIELITGIAQFERINIRVQDDDIIMKNI